MIALIGSQGTVGHSILDQISVDAVFNSDNITDLSGQSYNTVYIAAPSGNRLAINRQQGNDEQDFQQIQTALAAADVKQVIFISSVDAVTAPDSRYGRNRANMETWIRNNYADYYIIRLSTLVGKHIKKNVLFDLKHNIFIDRIDFSAVIQWCILDTLRDQIELAQANKQREIDLVSQPIANWEIVQKFFPTIYKETTGSTVFYDQHPYRYTRRQIFAAMENYLT